VPDIRPTAATVAALLRSRTRDEYGDDTGEFDATTDPTLAEVEELITTAVDLVTPRLGPIPLTDADPEPFVAMATAIAALRTGLLIEQARADDIQPGQHPYASLLGEYNAAVRDWDVAVAPYLLKFGAITITTATGDA